MRKKVDQRIRTLVENSVKLHQRSMFVIVGDRGRDQARRVARLRAARCAPRLRRARARAQRLPLRKSARCDAMPRASGCRTAVALTAAGASPLRERRW